MKTKLRIALWIAYSVLWLGGVGSHLLFGRAPSNTPWAAPSFLWLAASLSFSPPVLIAAAVGFTAEVIGLRCGVPFGSYVYTDALGPRVLGVPVAIAAAWMTVFAFARQIVPPGKWFVPLGAVSMTAIDLLIDPLASGTLGYWRWLAPGSYFGVPLSNFAGWLLVSAIVCAIDRSREPRNKDALAVGFSVILFFAAIGITSTGTSHTH